MGPDTVGRPLPRKEGRAKVTGTARYVDDLALPGMLYGVTVRSTQPRARIRNIEFDPSFPWHECVVVSADDIPGNNSIALIQNDQPCLAAGLVNHVEEPVLLIAHPDRYAAEEARRGVRIEYEPLPALFTVEEALAGKEIIWGQDNIFKSYTVRKGEIEKGFAEAAWIVEGEYSTGAQEQLYIEPQGMLAVATPEMGITVWGSMQCPYYIHKALMHVFGLPEDRVRVVQCETGGGFGGKEEYPSIIAAHAALLAWKSRRPVKIIYDRAEDIAATTKRHPSRTRHRTAVSAEGRLLAMEIDFTIDGGAYSTLSPVVLSRGTIHAAGPYHCENVLIQSRAVATNYPPHGAFRGFGAPQSIFALERHMDRIARTVGLDPAELRRRNFLQRGQRTATGQVIREDLDLAGILDRAISESGYEEKRRRFPAENRTGKILQGVGLAAFMHGAGFTGSGERYLQSVAGVEASSDGRVRILVSSSEMGQGSNTVLCQIAAAALGIDYDAVEIAQPDTALVPNSGPTVASRTAMIVGKLVESAAIGLKQTLAQTGLLDGTSFARACRQYIAEYGGLKCFGRYEPPPGIHWDDENTRGDAYGAYSWAVDVAEVAVDTVTYETRVTDFVAVQEIGKVINPVLAAGQIEGGVAQAIGYALYENVVYEKGRVVNARMTNYSMPTSADLPPIRTIFLENPYASGPFGAKGIGELPMDGPAPAILSAVEHATGVCPDSVPLTPERLLELMEAARG